MENKIEIIYIDGICFNKGAILKMSKKDFVKIYNESLWEKVQLLKPKTKKKTKKAE